jgi:predicted phage gp36 major capsid-like protein
MIKNIYSDKIIDFYYRTKPKVYFELNKKYIDIVSKLQDANGKYLFYYVHDKSNKTFNKYTLLGIPLYEVDNDIFFLRIIYSFCDGTSNQLDLNIGDIK